MDPSATFSTGSGSLTLSAAGDISLGLLSSTSGQVTVTSTGGSLLRTAGYAGTNISATVRPVLRAAKIIDLTVVSDSVSVSSMAGYSSVLFRRSDPSILIYLVFA